MHRSGLPRRRFGQQHSVGRQCTDDDSQAGFEKLHEIEDRQVDEGTLVDISMFGRSIAQQSSQNIDKRDDEDASRAQLLSGRHLQLADEDQGERDYHEVG